MIYDGMNPDLNIRSMSYVDHIYIRSTFQVGYNERGQVAALQVYQHFKN